MQSKYIANVMYCMAYWSAAVLVQLPRHFNICKYVYIHYIYYIFTISIKYIMYNIYEEVSD